MFEDSQSLFIEVEREMRIRPEFCVIIPETMQKPTNFGYFQGISLIFVTRSLLNFRGSPTWYVDPDMC